MVHTIRFTRRKLPHWEVEHGRYFVTVRCADSLPRETILRLAELQTTLAPIRPRSPEFAAVQRQVFRTLERHLDAGFGACALRHPDAARIVVAELDSISTDWKVAVPHYTIMPNHWHALIVPAGDGKVSLSQIMARIKGRTARAINAVRRQTGALWQREWFDRWVRDDAEWERTVAYIRNNPVKAGLAKEWTQHAWTK